MVAQIAHQTAMDFERAKDDIKVAIQSTVMKASQNTCRLYGNTATGNSVYESIITAGTQPPCNFTIIT